MNEFKVGDILISKNKSEPFSDSIHYVVRKKQNDLIVKPVIENIVIDNDWLEFPLHPEHFEKIGVEKSKGP